MLTLANVPTAGLFLDGEYSENGLDDVTSVTQSATQETVNLRFKRPSTLQNGTYGDTLTLRICNEDPCRTEIRGSPITINVSYQVTGTGRYSVIAGKTSVAMNTVDTAGNGVTDAVPLLVSPPPTEQLFFDVRSSTTGLASATARGTTNATVDLQFKPGMQLAPRAHDDTVTVRACYDSACIRQLTGSPLTISTRLTVAIAPEQGLDPLVVRSRTALPHNVIDAEYSNALDAIVMVSTFPSNALHVYSTATGTTRSQPLGKAPTSVSLAPNGLTAAVGHDALISVVELANVGQAGAPAPRLLNVSADVFDLVLDARGKVHAFPRIDQWVVAHTVDVASNVETLGTGTLRAGSHARLHPSGDFIYAADNGLSPSDIAKWNVASGTAQLLYDSPYHGQYAMCGNLWFDTPGNSIYTACGNTFRSSATQSLDMVYSGRLQLWSAALIGGTFQIGSLSHSTARGEVALVEYDGYACANFGSLPCNTHLATYESALLNRRTVHSIGPAIVSGTGYRQRGLFVFDQANGGRRFLISRLLGYPDPATEYQLSILD
ncbi:MAG: hypothetical protein MUF07_01565 [Steroidobacteraceae bacterium]|nr:hypothetical protein [Steroidobacteraceae bacterium]